MLDAGGTTNLANLWRTRISKINIDATQLLLDQVDRPTTYAKVVDPVKLQVGCEVEQLLRAVSQACYSLTIGSCANFIGNCISEANCVAQSREGEVFSSSSRYCNHSSSSFLFRSWTFLFRILLQYGSCRTGFSLWKLCE